MEKEFFLIQPSLKKEEIVENWTETMSHLDVVLGSEHQQEVYLCKFGICNHLNKFDL